MKHMAYENADAVMTCFAYMVMTILGLAVFVFLMGIIIVLNDLR